MMGLDVVELVMTVEEHYGFTIPDAEAREMRSVGDTNMHSRSLRSHLNSLVILRFADGEEVEALLLGADETRDKDITYEVRRILKLGSPTPKGSEIGGTCVAPLKDLVDWSSVDA